MASSIKSSVESKVIKTRERSDTFDSNDPDIIEVPDPEARIEWIRSPAVSDVYQAAKEKCKDLLLQDEVKMDNVTSSVSCPSSSSLSSACTAHRRRLANVQKSKDSLSPVEQMAIKTGRIDRLVAKTKLQDPLARIGPQLAHISESEEGDEEIEESDDDDEDDDTDETVNIDDNDGDDDNEREYLERRRVFLLAAAKKVERRLVRVRQRLAVWKRRDMENRTIVRAD